MRYAIIRTMDINNGPGICASLYVQGCRRRCEQCFNPDTWDYNGGHEWNKDVQTEFIKACKNEHVKNICILGGEPLDQGKDLLDLLLEIKKEVRKPIWLWTGYIWEDIIMDEKQKYFASESVIREEIASMCDVLVDGPFIYTLKDNSLRYRGSSNQRVIAVQESLRQDKIVLLE